MSDINKAIILFSGGQDSATILAWALQRFDWVETLGFSYGQRHNVEMKCRQDVLKEIKSGFKWGKNLGTDHVLDLSVLGEISKTSLTRNIDIEEVGDTGMPNSFVPGRNLLFLNFASALGYRRGINHLVAGMCEADFSGYPDCRKETLDAQMRAISLGMEREFILHTPLMYLSKADAWGLAEELGGDKLVNLINQKTHTCYKGERKTHDWGAGCGACPACDLRAKGWAEYKANKNGL